MSTAKKPPPTRVGNTPPARPGKARTETGSPARVDVAALIDQGAALYRKGQIREALQAALRGLALDPDNADLLNHQGVFAARLGDAATAEAAYRRAIAARPDGADTHYNLGNLLKAQNRPGEAEAAYRRAIALRPDHAQAYSNLGLLLEAQDRLEEAVAAQRRAIALNPDLALAHSNLGNALKSQKRPQEAEAAYRRAIALNPDLAEAHSNLGVLLRLEKRAQEAEAAYRRAIALAPGQGDARLNLGYLLLKLGRYAEGWREHEARHLQAQPGGNTLPPPTAAGGAPLPPQWRGEPLAGRSLLVWPEQGLGDEIQFVRYLRLLKARGATHVTLACKPPLKPLFATQGLAERVISTEDWRPEMAAQFDYWCYALSLPLHFGTTLDTIPARLPYLSATEDSIARWAPRLPQARLRVGLVWKGRPAHKNDANRSLPSLAALAPLWSVPGIAYVSLQKGPGEDEANAPPADQPLTHLGGEIADFADSAAILSQLDLLICVDTAAAHLAGALGRPCWVLLPDYGTDWRWLEERADSPWYPNVMRLFRQATDGDWDETVARVREALEAWRADAPAAGPGVASQPSAPAARVAEPDPIKLAQGLAQAGRHNAAIEALTRALTRDPDSATAHFLLGNAYQGINDLDAALKSYRRALALEPRHVYAHNNMGGAYQHQGRLDAAIEWYKKALALKPDYPEALNNLGGALQLQGRLDASVECYRRALALRPYYPEANSSLLMALAGHPRVAPAAYLAQARQFGEKMRARAKPFTAWPADAASSAPPKLRVGLVSGELRSNPVGYFLESTLAKLDPARIELLAFATDPRQDALSARIKPRFAEWHTIAGLGDEAAARKIHAAAPHILIDLAGHTAHNRLPVFAWKPAPVQLSWLGYFASTGVPGMDYLLADPVSVREQDRAGYAETVWLLPDTRLCFTPPADASPEVSPLPMLRQGHVTFGSFQRLTKLNDAVLAAWARILHALPNARLRLQTLETRRPETREQLVRRLEAAGIARDRVAVLPDTPRAGYLAAHAEIDIILDTFPFPGGTTTCEALWMGVPTLTLSGETLLARQGASLMRAAGLDNWVTESTEDYVARAIALAAAPDQLAELRRQLRARVGASPLFDAPRFARNLEAALYGMWERYAAQGAGSDHPPRSG